jgi:hypothetical protein
VLVRVRRRAQPLFAMASSSPFSSSPAAAADGAGLQLVEKRSRKIDWMYVTPLFLMALPLIRMLKIDRQLKNKLFYGGVALGLTHGTWLIMRSQPPDEDLQEEKYYTPPTAVRGQQAHVAPAASPAPAAAAAPPGAAAPAPLR